MPFFDDEMDLLHSCPELSETTAYSSKGAGTTLDINFVPAAFHEESKSDPFRSRRLQRNELVIHITKKNWQAKFGAVEPGEGDTFSHGGRNYTVVSSGDDSDSGALAWEIRAYR